MRSFLWISLFLIVLLLQNNIFATGINTNEILMSGMGTNYFGMAMISVLAALLVRNTSDKK